MKLKNKKTTTAITLAIMLTFVTLFASISTIRADVAVEVPTYCFLTATPSPIGSGQSLGVHFWLDKVSPSASGPTGERFENIMVTIVKPDGNTENRGPFTMDAVSSSWFAYTPTQIGTYTFQMNFPGQHMEGFGGFPFPRPFNNTYLPSSSSQVPVVVQQDPIPYWPENPLPTDYWARPISAENHGWWQISGAWLAAGATGGPHGPRAYDENGNYNPYTESPDAPHVMWTKEIAFGGLVGGVTRDIPYYPGETYERKFRPPIVMNGRLYYCSRLGNNAYNGFICVDMDTGEEVWFQEARVDDRHGPLLFGQLFDYESPNQHGVIPYLWDADGSTYRMYDAFTGDWILDIANVSGGTQRFGPNGEIMKYYLSGSLGVLRAWNSTKAINPTIDRTWSWRPPMGGIVDGNDGYEYEVNVTAPTGSIQRVYGGVIYAASGNTWIGYDRWTGEKLWTTDVNKAAYPPDARISSKFDPATEVLCEFVYETMQWYGYNVRTGVNIWGPTEPYTNAWGFYQAYADVMISDGKLLTAGYDGFVHCYDVITGDNLWNYHSGYSGFETPYGHWVAKDNALTLAGGKVFVTNNEHSPSVPFYRGCMLHAIDAETGEGLWNITTMGLAPIVADGRLLTFNYYDGRIYCFGKGQSATTVSVADDVTSQGSSVLIQGTVTDQSPAQKDTTAVSGEVMRPWMEYLHMQKQIPTEVSGVPVTVSAMSQDGAITNIGTATSNGYYGTFSIAWTPPEEGIYTIMATFNGDESYGSSSAATDILVGPAAPTPQPTPSPTPSPSPLPSPGPGEPAAPIDMYLIAAAVAVVAVIVVALVFLRKRK